MTPAATPANVGWRDEMPGWPQHMGAQDSAFGEGLLYLRIRHIPQAHTQAPLGRGIILGLNGSEMGHQLRGIVQPRRVEVLVGEAQS